MVMNAKPKAIQKFTILVYKNQFLKYILRMIKHGERPSDHITEPNDIPPSPEAVYNKERHIKPSFLHKLAWKSLETDAQRIEGLASRKRLSPEEVAEIMSLKERAKSLKSKIINPNLSNSQFTEMRVHVMKCLECRQKMRKIRGDLLDFPSDIPPLTNEHS